MKHQAELLIVLDAAESHAQELEADAEDASGEDRRRMLDDAAQIRAAIAVLR